MILSSDLPDHWTIADADNVEVGLCWTERARWNVRCADCDLTLTGYRTLRGAESILLIHHEVRHKAPRRVPQYR